MIRYLRKNDAVCMPIKTNSLASQCKNLLAKQKHWLRSMVLGCGATLLAASAGLGAEKISLSYGLLEFSIPVASLELYARDGKIDRHLAFYARQVKPKDMEKLRIILRKRIPVSSITVYRFFYSSFGETILEFFGSLIRADERNGFYVLRGSLILAAADSEGLTLLNVLKKFPLPTIRVNLDRVFETVKALSDLFDKTDRVVALIDRQATVEAAEQRTSSTQPMKLSQLGNWTWDKETLMLNDRSRNRKLAADIYRPHRQGKIPVLVISHGLGASRTDFSELAEHLASHGFAVAMLDHPGSDRQQIENLLKGLTKEIAEPSEFINRPLDVSYLLDELQRLDRSGSSRQGQLDLSRVGVLGYSFGGYTALALAGAELNLDVLKQECRSERINLNVGNLSMLFQCLASKLPATSIPPLRDDRVRAVFAFSPFTSYIFGQQGLSQIQIPTMLIAGSDDAITPALLEQVCPFTWLTSRNKHLALIEGGTHIYTATDDSSLFDVPELISPASDITRYYLKALGLAFAKTYIANESKYNLYLNAAYARSISQSPVELKLVRSLNTTSQIVQPLSAACPYATLQDDED